jgi:uncharacterized membrane protein
MPSVVAQVGRPPWKKALAPALAISFVTLGLGYWLKARCLNRAWGGGNEFRHFCYNDLLPLYGTNGYAAGETPYVTVQNEYPVLTGIIPWVLARFLDGLEAWWHGNAILLLLAGLGVTALLVVGGHDWRSAAPWVLAPSVVVDGFTNWDLWAVFFLTAGIVAFQRGRLGLAGFAIGLGTAAKLFPAFAGLAMLLVVVNRARARGPLLRDANLRREAMLLATGFTLGWLPVNLAFLLNDPYLWWATYVFHSERGTSFQATWYLIDQYIAIPAGHPLSLEEFNRGSLALTALAMAGLVRMALRSRTQDVALLSLAFVGASILTGKFLSPQYVLWLLPLLVLGRLPRELWAALTAGHVVSVLWAYHFRLPPPGATEGVSGEFLPLLNFWSAVFLGAIAAIVAACVLRMRKAPLEGAPSEIGFVTEAPLPNGAPATPQAGTAESEPLAGG